MNSVHVPSYKSPFSFTYSYQLLKRRISAENKKLFRKNITMTKLRHGSHGRDTWKSKASQFPTWKPWIEKGTQNEKLMIVVKKSTFFSPPNTWIINKKLFSQKSRRMRRSSETLTHVGYKFNGFELKHKNRLAG